MKRIRADLAGFVRLLPVLLLLGGVAADITTPEPYTGLPLLTAAPLVAGIVLSFRASAATALLGCAISVASDHQLGRPAPATIVDVSDVVLIGVIALFANRALARKVSDLAVARDIAEAAQRAVLPMPPPLVGPLAVAARYEAAQAEARIGGDLYAVQETPFGVRVIVGDVRGKGLQAVSAVSVVVGTFREAAEQAATLSGLAARIDLALDRTSDRTRVDDLEGFTTALLAEISPDGSSVRLLSRGHPPPYLVHGGQVTCLETGATDLPLGMGLPDSVNTTGPDTFPLPAEASLLLVTDGVTEARNRRGTFYDPRLGLGHRVFHDPGELVNELVADVARWTGGQRQDDIAILALTRCP